MTDSEVVTNLEDLAPRMKTPGLRKLILTAANRIEDRQAALTILQSAFGSDPDQVATSHPAVAGAIRMLTP